MERFRIFWAETAFENNYPDSDEYEGSHCYLLYETDGTKPIRLVASDQMEPEDATLGRDLSWVQDELNKLADRIQELELKETA